MSVRKRFNKWWVDFRFNGKRYRKPSPDNTRAGAIAYEILLRQKLARSESILDTLKEERERINFKDFAQKWFDVYVKSNNKFSEIVNKRSILRVHLIPYFAGKYLDDIGGLDIEEYKTAKLESGLSPKSVNNHLIVLSRCLHVAEEWNMLEKVPKIKKIKVAPAKYDFLTEAESQELLNATDGLLHEMILTALKTGMRIGELIALDWSDIDLGDRLLTVRRGIARGCMGSTKSNRIRQIPLTDEVCEMLSKKTQRQGFVFVNKGDNHLRAEYCLKLLKRTCAKIGFRKIGWHTLRHTFASHLATNNVPMKAIQELLGHSSILTTMRYSHICHSTLRDAVRTIDRKYFGHNMVTAPATASPIA